MEALKHKLTTLKNDDIGQFSLDGIKTWGKVVEIYDGDTCRIILLHNDTLHKFNCRLIGIDTPEMKPALSKLHREEEIHNAHKCRNRLIQLVTNCEMPSVEVSLKSAVNKKLLDTNTKLIIVKCGEFDKYGRLLVTLFPDGENGVCANETLIGEKYAKSYDGGTKDVFSY